MKLHEKLEAIHLLGQTHSTSQKAGHQHSTLEHESGMKFVASLVLSHLSTCFSLYGLYCFILLTHGHSECLWLLCSQANRRQNCSVCGHLWCPPLLSYRVCTGGSWLCAHGHLGPQRWSVNRQCLWEIVASLVHASLKNLDTSS